MPTTTRPLYRSAAAVVAVSSLLFAQGCFAYQRPPARGVSPDSRVRVQSVEPFVVMPAGATDTPRVDTCRATVVEGFVSSASADVMTFQGLSRVVPANGDAASCRWAKSSAVVVPIAGADVAVNRFSGQRTGIFLLVTAVTLVALMAYAVSTIDYGLGGGAW